METKPKLALVGYGNMGKEIETIAKDQDFIISDIFEIDNPVTNSKTLNFDIAIIFSLPETVTEIVEFLCRHNKSMVIGTTGWNDQKDYYQKLCLESNNAIIYSSNFSIGMQIFYRIINKASALINNLDIYDIMVHELHHKRKVDSPSGTALSLAEIINSNINRKTTIETETSHTRINESALHVSSTRGGEITGTHTIYMDSLADTIELTHRAKNRKGLALGAVEAAKWLYGKQGFYAFEDIVDEILEK